MQYGSAQGRATQFSREPTVPPWDCWRCFIKIGSNEITEEALPSLYPLLHSVSDESKPRSVYNDMD